MTTLLPDIRSPWFQPKIGDYSRATDDQVGQVLQDILDVDQCVRIILTTPKGTDPHRPDFAADFLPYLDWPINKATPYIVRESLKAILTWEPRVEVMRIGVKPEPEYAHSIVEIHWRLKDPPRQHLEQLTEVCLGEFI